MLQSSIFTSPTSNVTVQSLPVMPPQVNLSHLHSNHKLFTDEEIKNIHSVFNQTANLTSLHHQSSRIQKYFRVVKLSDNNLYAIYYGRNIVEPNELKELISLGNGSYGKVKLVQSLASGEWHALKVSKKINLESYEAEKTNLKTMGLLIATGEETNRITQVRRRLTAIQLEKGLDLNDFIERKKLEFPLLLAIMINMSQAVAHCHEKGLWHGDIKVNNFMINPVSHEVTLIDFGFSLPKDKKNNYKGRCAPGYAAYEIHPCNPFQMDLNLTEKTEIRALGMSFAVMIDAHAASDRVGPQLYPKSVWLRVEENNKLTKRTCELIPFSDFRNEFLDYLRRMTHENPAMRPTLSETKTYLENTLKKLALKKAIMHVGMVNLNQLIENPLSRETIKLLKEMNYVSLIANQCVKEENACGAHNQLTRLGLVVQDCIYYVDQASPLALIKEAKNAIAQGSSLTQQFYYFTKEKLTADQRRKVEDENIIINTVPSPSAQPASTPLCLVS